MEDLFEVRITEGLFPAGLVQSLLLNTKCIERYSRVLQVTLLREQFTLPIPKNIPPFGMSHRSTAISPKLQNHLSLFRTGTTITPLPPFHMTFCTVSGSSRACGNKKKV